MYLFLRDMIKIFTRFKPDVIHAHSTYIVFGRVLNQLDLDIPVIATIHGLPKPLILPGQIQTTDLWVRGSKYV